MQKKIVIIAGIPENTKKRDEEIKKGFRKKLKEWGVKGPKVFIFSEMKSVE